MGLAFIAYKKGEMGSKDIAVTAEGQRRITDSERKFWFNCLKFTSGKRRLLDSIVRKRVIMTDRDMDDCLFHLCWELNIASDFHG